MLAVVALILLAAMLVAAVAIVLVAAFGRLPGKPLDAAYSRDFLRDNHPFGSYTDIPCDEPLNEVLQKAADKARGGSAPYVFRDFV